MHWDPRLEEYRIRKGAELSSRTGDPFGVFFMPGPCGRPLRVIAAGDIDPAANGWEHVSVSVEKNLPNWTEMCFIKDRFWGPEETVIQFHPPESQYVNNFRVLHLWRWTRGEIPLPPAILVGVMGVR